MDFNCRATWLTLVLRQIYDVGGKNRKFLRKADGREIWQKRDDVKQSCDEFMGDFLR
jgi:hypothetical protein